MRNYSRFIEKIFPSKKSVASHPRVTPMTSPTTAVNKGTYDIKENVYVKYPQSKEAADLLKRGISLFQEKKLQDARRSLDLATKSLSDVLPSDHPLLGIAYNNLAESMRNLIPPRKFSSSLENNMNHFNNDTDKETFYFNDIRELYEKALKIHTCDYSKNALLAQLDTLYDNFGSYLKDHERDYQGALKYFELSRTLRSKTLLSLAISAKNDTKNNKEGVKISDNDTNNSRNNGNEASSETSSKTDSTTEITPSMIKPVIKLLCKTLNEIGECHMGMNESKKAKEQFDIAKQKLEENFVVSDNVITNNWLVVDGEARKLYERVIKNLKNS